MTLPKGYVIPTKEADEKAKREADEKAKREADEKAKREADEKAKSNLIDSVIDKKEEDRTVVRPNSSNVFDYYSLWEQIGEAYLQTVKEATSSYFRLLDFWSQLRSKNNDRS